MPRMNPNNVDRRDFIKAAGTSAIVTAVAGGASITAEAATADELCFSSAVELARLIRSKQVSAREVMAAHLARIERFNPTLERDRRQAR